MTSSISKKLDQELVEWIDLPGDDSREVIVEAEVPQRLVSPVSIRGPVGRRGIKFAGGTGASAKSERSEVLRQLQSFITELVGCEPTVLSSSAAIPLIATRQQLQQIACRPEVKAVRVNRRLR